MTEQLLCISFLLQSTRQHPLVNLSRENPMPNPEKAYKNLDFLNSKAARTIRILCEYEEPKARFEEEGVENTIVMFGSARIRSGEEAVVSGLGLGRHCDDDLFKAAYTAAVNRLIGRWSPDAVCLIGGVVEHRQDLFEGIRLPVGSYGRIIHPCPALLGAARAAFMAL